MSHSTTPDHRPGDIVNGHVLVQHPDGAMTWEPMTTAAAPAGRAEPTWWKRKRIIIPAAVLVGLVAIAGIGNAVRQPPNPAASRTPRPTPARRSAQSRPSPRSPPKPNPRRRSCRTSPERPWPKP